MTFLMESMSEKWVPFSTHVQGYPPKGVGVPSKQHSCLEGTLTVKSVKNAAFPAVRRKVKNTRQRKRDASIRKREK